MHVTPATSRPTTTTEIAAGVGVPRLSILGEPLTVVDFNADSFLVRTKARLCPGRRMVMRVEGSGSTTVTATTCVILELTSSGPLYEVELVPVLATADSSAPEQISA